MQKSDYRFDPCKIGPYFLKHLPPPTEKTAEVSALQAELVQKIKGLQPSLLETICLHLFNLEPNKNYRCKKATKADQSFFLAQRQGAIFAVIGLSKILYQSKNSAKKTDIKVRTAFVIKFSLKDGKMAICGAQDFVIHRIKLDSHIALFTAAARVDAAENLAQVGDLLQPCAWGQYTGKEEKFALFFPRMQADYLQFMEKFKPSLELRERNFPKIAIPLIRALVAMHRHPHQYLHRDPKVDNILVDHDNEGNIQSAKLIDCDLCTTLTENDIRRDQIVGTPAFMAPELIAFMENLEWPEFLTILKATQVRDVVQTSLDTYKLGHALFIAYYGYPAPTYIYLTEIMRLSADEKNKEANKDDITVLKGNLRKMNLSLSKNNYSPNPSIENVISRCLHVLPTKRPPDEELLAFAASLESNHKGQPCNK